MESLAEVWRDVKENTSYEVSSLGRVRSKPRLLIRKNGRTYRVQQRILSQAKLPRGYRFVSLYGDGGDKQCYIHRLVAEAFIGPCPEGMQVNHKDLDKSNNVPSNLEYVTGQENMAHAHRAGRLNGAPKYTPEQIRHGYSLVKGGMKYKDAAMLCGMKQDALEAACRGDNWKKLGLEPLRRVTVPA